MNATASFDQRQLRTVLGTFVTGVTIITTRDAQGVAHGVTANSFSSVSLDPPLVLWSQALTSKSYPSFRDSEHFAVNILADDQVAISNHFAKSHADKFQGIAHADGVGGAPVLDGSAAHLECTKVATYPGGDHVVYLGRVERVGRSSRRPLAFGSGRYMVPYAHELGPVALQLGNAVTATAEQLRVAVAAMPSIAEQLGQHTVCLAVWGNHGPTIVHWEPSANPVSPYLRTGLVTSVTRSATGRNFAAFMPDEVTAAFIGEDLRLYRGADEDEAEQRRSFDVEIAETRRSGLARATSTEPSPLHRVAVNAFSAPIHDHHSRMLMALSMTTPASRLGHERGQPVPQMLAQAARDISARLG